MNRWWDDDPVRLQFEIDSFARYGANVQRDNESFDNGKATFQVKWPHAGGVLDLRVIYPDFYPFFPPRVAALGISLPHHHNPYNGEICLLQDGKGDWNIEETAADLIAEQLPKVFASETCRDKAVLNDLEVNQAEPVSIYYNYQMGTSMLIDGGWRVPTDMTQGHLIIGLEDSKKSIAEAVETGVRGAVLEVRDSSGKELMSLDRKLAQRYETGKFSTHWFRLSSAPPAFTADGIVSFIKSEYADIFKYLEKKVNAGGEGVVAFIFPEESQHRVLQGDGWVFYAFSSKLKKKAAPRVIQYLTRAFRSGEADVTARIPELNGLRQKCIAVIGLGCVGAPSALEFARCGVREIRVLEDDYLDPGNSCRWPLGLPAAGHHKFAALQAFIRRNYPYVTMDECLSTRLGHAGSQTDQLQGLETLLNGVDLIYDATGDANVQLFMSTWAWKAQIPYVLIESRPGGYGGVVARFIPGRNSGCYYCLKHSQVDACNGKEGGIALPPQKQEDFVQPQGCASPTFTAASFDTTTVSLAGVRMAVSILCSSSQGGYPEIAEDVGVLSVRDMNGRATFPIWSTYVLKPHPDCGFCKT